MRAHYDGDEFTTASGRRVHVLDPRPEDVVLADVAHALSMVCRFGGHVPFHYSVAQHSLLVSAILQDQGEPPHVQLCGLLHDAAEAYLGDVITPLKRQLPQYADIEAKWQAAIGHALGVGDDLVVLPPGVKDADVIAFFTEWRDLFPYRPMPEGGSPSPGRGISDHGTPGAAEMAFRKRYYELAPLPPGM